MRRRIASINDVPIQEADRLYHWPLGRRPDDHPGLSELGLKDGGGIFACPLSLTSAPIEGSVRIAHRRMAADHGRNRRISVIVSL
jgi:hypothetical protein